MTMMQGLCWHHSFPDDQRLTMMMMMMTVYPAAMVPVKDRAVPVGPKGEAGAVLTHEVHNLWEISRSIDQMMSWRK